MTRLEDLRKGLAIRGLVPGSDVQIIDVSWHGSAAAEVTYKDSHGKLGNELLYRNRESALALVEEGGPWSYDADGRLFRLASEAQRIRLGYLFDPLLAVHTSMVEPLPHQITAVYEVLLPRQPLHFLLADDPGSGKTIMTGLLVRELIARGDLKRCLICCPGNLDEQWQDEMANRFHLDFRIVSRQLAEQAKSGNPFSEWPLVIARLDWMSRNEDVRAKLSHTEWDLVVVDEAHKMSATFFGGEVRETKRYKLGRLLGGITRNLLLLTATPHNGKDEDFQLFMALLDEDRFEGRPRNNAPEQDLTDLMRRMIKEDLRKFDGSPLFPERKAYTVNYPLPTEEKSLYDAVTGYVRDEFNRADKLQNGGRKGTVGFALTTLQRRLASSPAAIHESLRRRRERLERRLKEERSKGVPASASLGEDTALPSLTEEEIEDLEDAPSGEVEQTEESILDQATAARTISELEQELAVLRRLEEMARLVLASGSDRKWEELSKILQDNPEMFDVDGNRRKVVIFTEHRDTLHYLLTRIQTLLGRPEAVRFIDGSLSREERRSAQSAFTQDRGVAILVATDAAGEGINLQRAHLMVNYDLPWNPNRIEQRFGRIHRIGQTEVCHLWNLVASETREGEVYARLLEKLKDESKALGGRVFDVLGKLFREQRLRDLLIEAVRYGERPDVRRRLDRKVDELASHQHLVELIEERALATDAMDSSRIQRIREDMERAEALKLQPHYIRSFFMAAFEEFGGSIKEREERRYEISHVPNSLRSMDSPHESHPEVLPRYERVVFDKGLISVPGKPLAEFLCPGHPLLDAVISLAAERFGPLLKRGTTLVDAGDPSDIPRVLCYIEHSIQDARLDKRGSRRVVSREMQFVEVDASGSARSAGYAPYLDYRPITEVERSLVEQLSVELIESKGLEDCALQYAVAELVPRHYERVARLREERIAKTKAAVQERLTSAIRYWDSRALELKDAELRGRPNAKINSGKARQRAEDLEARLKKRMEELEQERNLSPLPPVAIGGALVIPIGLIDRLRSGTQPEKRIGPGLFAQDRERSERLAIEAVLAAERELGRHPKDRSPERLPFDIESTSGEGQRLLFIESKGRVEGAATVTVSRNEILTGLNKGEDYILALVLIKKGVAQIPVYVRHPYTKEPDFAATSVNYDLEELLRKGGPPS